MCLPSKRQKQSFLLQTKLSLSPGDIALDREQTLKTWSPLHRRQTRGVVLVFLNLPSLTLPPLSGFCWFSWPCTPKLDPVLLLPDRHRSFLLESLDLHSETPNTGSVASRAASETNCVNLAIEGYLTCSPVICFFTSTLAHWVCAPDTEFFKSPDNTCWPLSCIWS